MKNSKGILTGFAATLWMFMGTNVMGQGSLTPPGAPGETMKTLAQVEPRTPISSLPYTISEPGSYYVTGNLSSTGSGIIIESSGVTVDLMGFSLTGDGGSGDQGIHVAGSAETVKDRVVIKGGSISGFSTGAYCEHMSNSRIKDLAITENTDTGIRLDGYDGQCNGNTISGCTISGNLIYGLILFGDNGQCDRNVLSGCIISENGSAGIMLNAPSGQCNGNSLAGCTISGNQGIGIYLYGPNGQCNGNSLAGCTISGNGVDGVTLYGFSGQCNGNTIADCTINDNGDLGVFLYGGTAGQCNGNTITDCTISENGDYGVYLRGDSGQCNGNTIQDNRISKNTHRGINLWTADGNRVEANNVWGTTGASYGIRTGGSGTDNFILKNTCAGQTDNFYLDAADTYGPEVTSSGALSSTGAASHPWANFSR